MSDTRDAEPLNVRVARIAGWRPWTEADRDPKTGICTLDDGEQFCRWVGPDGYHTDDIPDFGHDPEFFVRLMVANKLDVGPTLTGNWAANIANRVDECSFGDNCGLGPDPIHAVLDWIERAHASKVAIRWEVE